MQYYYTNGSLFPYKVYIWHGSKNGSLQQLKLQVLQIYLSLLHLNLHKASKKGKKAKNKISL